MRGWLLCSILIVCGASWGQEARQIQATELRLSDSHQLSVPAFMAFGKGVCYGDGNLYYRPVSATGTFRTSVTIMRLNPKTEMPTLYDLPSELADKVSPIEFSVTVSGRVWLLDQTQGGEYVVFGFDSTGRMSSRIPLDTPSGMFENGFKVADDGVILVAGYYGDVAPKEMQGKPYLALFDQNGAVRKTLGSDDLDRVDLTAAAKGPVEGDVASGPDGNFYILQRNDILVVSEWGDIVRRMKFVWPENDVWRGSWSWRMVSSPFHSIKLIGIDRCIRNFWFFTAQTEPRSRCTNRQQNWRRAFLFVSVVAPDTFFPLGRMAGSSSFLRHFGEFRIVWAAVIPIEITFRIKTIRK